MTKLDVNAVISTLQDYQDPINQRGMEAYLRDQFAFLGIKTPLRRNLTKPYINQAKAQAKTLPPEQAIDWDAVDKLWQQLYREYQYVATDYLHAMSKYLQAEDLSKLKDLIQRKSWWDTVDALVKRVGDITLTYPHTIVHIRQWAQDDNMWVRRAAILHQLGHKDRTDVALLSEVIAMNFGESEFFINKAIGWALREYAKTDAIWVKDYVHSHQNELHPLSIREALKNV